jgi:hypothetical protein
MKDVSFQAFLNRDKQSKDLFDLLQAVELASALIDERINLGDDTRTRYHAYMRKLSLEVSRAIKKRARVNNDFSAN